MRNVRYLTVEDLSIYYSLLLQGIHKKLEVYAWKYQNEHCISKNVLTDILDINNNHHNVIGVFEGSELVGAATLIHDQSYGLTHKAIIENLCANGSDHEEKEQIAEILMEHLFQICREKKIEILLTSLISNNISGKVFFSQLNFETLVLEHHARKYGERYVDEHWLIYNFLENEQE
ncbi:GNAT family N-acetyltransferase [Staphylococcus gallinarum]|jgi:hypothetical protein|uniref:GNAT family N-acetyltransferase n=1 Tax=Staphylococcus gallinarum TaxID=1293 RepID=UPI0024422579|nr:GNAT family N-acetyltransferase [Staphylococcus gallinarum]MEB7037636.1 GNAT family N-acetyltransferase [Staphylococcus gallinarum]